MPALETHIPVLPGADSSVHQSASSCEEKVARFSRPISRV